MDTWPYAIAIFVVALLLLLVTLGVIGPTSGKNLNLDNLTVHSIHGNSPIEIQDDLTFGGEHSVLETLKVESQEFSVTNQFHFPKTRATVANSVLTDVQANGQLEWAPPKKAPPNPPTEPGLFLDHVMIDTLPVTTTAGGTIFAGARNSLRAWADVSYSDKRIFGTLWVSQDACNEFATAGRDVTTVNVEMSPVLDALRKAGGPDYNGFLDISVVGNVQGAVFTNTYFPGTALWGKIELAGKRDSPSMFQLFVTQDEAAPQETYNTLVSVYFSATTVSKGVTL
jgi:hypothetical protein